MKINQNKLVLNMVMFLPITTLLQGLVPIINRFLFFGIIIVLLYIFLSNKKSIYECLIMLCFFISYLISFFYTEWPLDNFNELFYLPFFMLISDYMINHYKYAQFYFKNNVHYLKTIVIVWNIIVVFSMFFSSSYDNGYFYSFTGNVFRSATSATFVLSLVMLLLTRKSCYIIYAIIPMYCIFSGGSRTYLVVGLTICLSMYYMVAPTKKFFIMTLIPIFCILSIMVLKSSIMDKIDSTLTVSSLDYYQDPLIKFTSGRSLFWSADIRAFFSGNLFNQIFGYGYNFVYDTNKIAINNRIWAHNDFINIMMCYGFLGLISYIFMFNLLIKKFVSYFHLPRLAKYIAIFIWLFNAFFNMFYTYVCACASYPLILYAFSFYEDSKKIL